MILAIDLYRKNSYELKTNTVDEFNRSKFEFFVTISNYSFLRKRGVIKEFPTLCDKIRNEIC